MSIDDINSNENKIIKAFLLTRKPAAKAKLAADSYALSSIQHMPVIWE